MNLNDLNEGGPAVVMTLIVSLVFYVYGALCLTVIARKTNTPNAWMAWFPLLNAILMCQVARKPAAWIILLMLPCINIFAFVILVAAIAQARGKSAGLAVLLFIPGLNLLLPMILAAGPATNPDGAPSSGGSTSGFNPGTCSSCHQPMQPNDVFCGNCGQQQVRQAAAPAQVPARQKSGGGVLVGVMAVAGIGLLVCCGGVGYFFYGPSNYTPAARRPPQVPQRLAGTMSVLPMDNVTQNGVRPTSIITQRFDGKNPGQSPPTVNVPTEKLPPGLDPQQIPQWAGGMTSVTYRGTGGGGGGAGTPGNSGGEVVNVHIIDTAGRFSGPAITSSIAQGTGGQQDPIQVQSPTGTTFTGTRIQAPQSVVFVLINPTGDLVVVVYGPNEASRPAAERLASNLGNSQGTSDPELEPYICVLPAISPPGLQIRDLQTFGTEELTAAGTAMQSTLNQPGVQGGAELAAQLQQVMPQMLVITTYEDDQGREWGSLVCDYGNPRKAWFLWFVIESLMRAIQGSTQVSVQGGKGISVSDAEARILIFFKGPYIVLLMGPSAEPVERLVELGASLQL